MKDEQVLAELKTWLKDRKPHPRSWPSTTRVAACDGYMTALQNVIHKIAELEKQ
jgi:hypothetical protein